MKKTLYLIPFISLFCFSCQKTEVKSPPGAISAGAVEGHLAGIGFYGGNHPLGDATIKYGSTTSSTTVAVPTGAQVQITAQPVGGYVVDHWWKYDVQPPYDGSAPLPTRTKVHSGAKSFSATITRETWFEPVFKLAPAIQLLVKVELTDVRGEITVEYWDQNNERQYISSTGNMVEDIRVYPYSQVYITGYYKLDDPMGHYSYWVRLNDDDIDMGMPYTLTGDFGFDHWVTIDPEKNPSQVLSFVIDKQPYP